VSLQDDWNLVVFPDIWTYQHSSYLSHYGVLLLTNPLLPVCSLSSPACSLSSRLRSSTTMSSPFSFDNWDQLLDSSPAPSPSASTAVPTPSSASTGEFQPFVAVGLSVAGGGGGSKSFFVVVRRTCGEPLLWRHWYLQVLFTIGYSLWCHGPHQEV
jgi:hypothetical protein